MAQQVSDGDQGAGPAPAQSLDDRISDKLFGNVEELADDAGDDAADEADGEDQSEADEGNPAPAPEVEAVEVEFGQWKGKIPKALKAEIEKGADYTRKTQELAEQRRLHDAGLRAQAEQQAFMQQAAADIEQFRAIDKQLEQYRNVDLSQVDGEQLSRLSMAAANLREERAKIKERLDSQRGEFRQKLVGAWDDMSSRAREAITKSVPDWDSVAPKVAEYALEQGYPFELITGYDRQTRERVGPGVVDPLFARTLHKAMQWDKLQSSRATAPAKAANAPPVLKPGATDTRSAKQVGLMNYRKALKGAQTAGQKTEVIRQRIEQKLFG